MRFIYCLILILSTSLGFAQASITRGADSAEVYISTLAYFDQFINYWGVLHSTDNGENFSLKYYNILNPPGEMEIVWLVGDATPGTLYNYGGGELWFSTDYGSTWEFLSEKFIIK